MSLRASFATGMLRKYRSWFKFGDMTEDQFLCYIAKLMNPSLEMLRETYIASDEKSFEVSSAIVRETIGAPADDHRVDDADLRKFVGENLA